MRDPGRAKRSFPPPASRKPPLLLVGIGASAGGLEAFTQLLEHLPADTGLSVVLVQHLDPSHESALVGILSRATTMPVREAVGGMPVRPNRVYVIPPNADLAVSNGVLRLRRRQLNGPRRAIDGFLESLAEDAGERAIGVVLSGTASDGTAGLEAIKAAGGITFAQDDSAKYDSMPRSAVAAGCVDFVLSPEAIAKELARIARHPRLGLGAPGDRPARKSAERAASADEPGGGYAQILGILRAHSGVDFSAYKPATLQRRMARRAVLLRIKTPDAYLRRLRDDSAERDALFQDVLIGVSGFFRNPDAFRALKKTVYPRLLKGRTAKDPVRVWVPGCAAGQEAYSVAMSLLEFMGAAPAIPLQIYGTDINEAMLDRARAGLYVKGLVQDVSPERLQRFFVAEEGAYRVSKAVREMCIFAKHDLLADPPFSRMDLICCRNLLIYFDQDAQRRIIPSFHYALKPTGALFLGASETVGGFSELFATLDKRHRLYAKIPGPSRAPSVPFTAFRRHFDKPPGGAPARPEVEKQDVLREADRIALRRYAPPGVLVNENMEILQFRGDTAPYLQPPRGKATFQLLKMARESVLLPLRAATDKARKQNRRIVEGGRGGARSTRIDVTPLKNLKERCYLVSFVPGGRMPAQDAVPAPSGAPAAAPAGARGARQEAAGLREELAETRDYLQSLQEQYDAAYEELQASSEEGQSSNEELQSINEELETSKEELESTNEELTTVNEEMAHRNGELTRLAADLNNLHASVDMAILLLDRELRLQRFTPLAAKLFNLMANDAGRPLGAVKSTLDFPDLSKTVSEVIATASARSREVRDAAGHWYSFRARPYLTLTGDVDGAVITLVDITSLKRALQRSEAIAETVPPLLILDADLRVQKVNRSYCELFQTSGADTVGRLVYELGNGQWNTEELRKLLQEVLPRDKSFEDFEVEHEFEHIGRRAVLLNGRQLSWGEKKRTILLSIQDVTERRDALKGIERYNVELERRVRRRTAQLTASNEELEAFCYSVAHDLRNPLRGIEGFSRVLAKNYSDKLDAAGQAYFERIRSAVYRMSHLIDSLLDLARLTRSEMRRVDTDLSQLARSIMDELKKKEPARKVEFVVAPGVKVNGDDRLLRIALANLLENAWKFTSKHPRARIEFGAGAEQGGEPIYFIRDDGAGFDMTYAGSLFKTFQRLHSAEDFPGTGIGLTIAQRIVQRHGGRMWAEGAVEKGATFFFSLSRPETLSLKLPNERRKSDRRAADRA